MTVLAWTESFVLFLQAAEDEFTRYRDAKAGQMRAESSTIGNLFGNAAAAVSNV